MEVRYIGDSLGKEMVRSILEEYNISINKPYKPDLILVSSLYKENIHLPQGVPAFILDDNPSHNPNKVNLPLISYPTLNEIIEEIFREKLTSHQGSSAFLTHSGNQ